MLARENRDKENDTFTGNLSPFNFHILFQFREYGRYPLNTRVGWVGYDRTMLHIITTWVNDLDKQASHNWEQ